MSFVCQAHKGEPGVADNSEKNRHDSISTELTGW